MPVCSIIVLNYFGEDHLAKTIESLRNLNYPKKDLEIIIVDNASTDKSVGMIKEFQRDFRIKPVFLKKNLGFAAGNNAGIRIAEGKYIVLLNNDCVVEPEWLTELVNVAEKDEKTFAVNSKIFLGDTHKIQNAGIRIFSNGYAQDIGAAPHDKIQDYEEDSGQYEVEREIDAACGAAVLYRKSILDKIGLLDESFFLYYEDVEISERAKLHGYKIMYAPKAVVHHKHAASSGEWSPFFIYQTEKGRLLHMIYHFPLRIFWQEYIKFGLKSLLRVAYGIRHPSRFFQQIQYIRVTISIMVPLPLYLIKRKRRHVGIPKVVIDDNYAQIQDNTHID